MKFALLAFALTVNQAIELDTVRSKDPFLDADEKVKTIDRFDARLKPLWLEALGRPENDLKKARRPRRLPRP